MIIPRQILIEKSSNPLESNIFNFLRYSGKRKYYLSTMGYYGNGGTSAGRLFRIVKVFWADTIHVFS